MKPICQIYDLVPGIKSKDLFQDALRITENRRSRRCEITNWCH